MCLSRCISLPKTDTFIFESSDWHSGPDVLPDYVLQWIALGKKKGARLIGNGDLFDLVLYPHDDYLQGNARLVLLLALNGYPFEYITGNHDPLNFVKKLELPDNIKVSKSLDIWGWHFEHGYQRALDWSVLSKVAPTFTNFMVDHAPHVWRCISLHMGWIASGVKPELDGEHTNYTKFISTIHRAYLIFGQKQNRNCVIGHTHAAFEAKAWKVLHECSLLDGGNLRDGSYVVIDKDGGRIEWLK
jgi:hypothetical protein